MPSTIVYQSLEFIYDQQVHGDNWPEQEKQQYDQLIRIVDRLNGTSLKTSDPPQYGRRKRPARVAAAPPPVLAQGIAALEEAHYSGACRHGRSNQVEQQVLSQPQQQTPVLLQQQEQTQMLL